MDDYPAVEALPLWEQEPDPDLVGVCDTCGGVTPDPDDRFCDDCWDYAG